MKNDREAGKVVFDSVLLAFLQTFSLPIPGALDTQALMVALKDGGFDAKWENPIAREFRVAEEFILPVERAGKHVRCEIDGFHVALQSRTAPGNRSIQARVFLTVYPSLDVAILLVSIDVQDYTVDDIIFLSQSISGRHPVPVTLPPLHQHHQDSASTRDALKYYISALRSCFHAATDTSNAHEESLVAARIAEIRICRPDDATTSDSLLAEHPKEVYGLLALDEGWRYVPSELAIARLGSPWRTREHVCVVTFESAILMVDRQYHQHNGYVRSQRELRENYHVRPEEYFDLKPQVAGLNHGPLLVLETCLMRTSFIADLHSFMRRRRPKSIKDLLRVRATLRDRLARLETFSIREVGVLEERILSSIGFDRAAAEVERILARVEADLTFKYTQNVNRLMLAVTVIILVWTVIGAVAAWKAR